MEKLAQELVDCIVDHLHGDQEDLFACSLTCRSWNTATGPHIFESLVVRTEEQLKSLENSFIPFAHVKRLKIIPQLGCEMAAIFAARFWSQLSQVKGLTLGSFEVDSEHPIEQLLANFSSLEILGISDSKFPSLHAFMHLLHLQPRLQKVQLEGVLWKKEREASDPAFHVPPLQWRTLRLINFDIDPFLDWLLELHPSLDLWDFYLKSRTHPNLEFGAHCMRVISSSQHSLKTLDLQVLGEFPVFGSQSFAKSTHGTDPDNLTSLDLSNFPSLETLLLPTTPFPMRLLQGIPEHLNQALLFSSWMILVDLTSKETGWVYPWDRIDNIFDSPTLGHVKLHVGIPSPEMAEKTTGSIAFAMPKATGRGVLSVENFSQMTSECVEPRELGGGEGGANEECIIC